jgi:hypothetical protein
MSAAPLSPLTRVQPRRASSLAVAFGLLGGPLAWLTELLSGYALASEPCFPHDQRLISPARDFAWTRSGIIVLLLVCVLVGFAAFLVSWRNLQRERIPAGAGRARFIALWGAALGAGFCVATLLTAVGIGLLPRCAG